MIKIKNIGLAINSAKLTLEKEVAVEFNKELEKLKTNLVNATPIDTGNARESWAITSKSIINTAEYISDLNNGHSDQAPENFIERVVLSNPRVKVNGIIVTDTE